MSRSSSVILHITTARAWNGAQQQGEYTAESLATEGFIHCSTPEQIVGVFMERFRGRDDHTILIINPAKVRAAIVYEDCYEMGQKFPHIYGPLNLDAVQGTAALPPDEDGFFALIIGL